MNLLIIEDEPLAVVRIMTLLSDIDPGIEILGSIASVQESVDWLLTQPQPDLILLDIALSDGSSFDIFKQVNIQSPVIFITAYDEFAIDAFNVFSIDYLLKPVSKSALEKALRKFYSVTSRIAVHPNYENLVQLLAESMKAYQSRFLIRAGKRLFFKSVTDVAFFQADDKTVFMVTVEGEKWIVDYSLEKLEEMLDPKNFFRLNRRIICRIESIQEIKTYPASRLCIHLKAGPLTEETIISREKVGAFKRWVER